MSRIPATHRTTTRTAKAVARHTGPRHAGTPAHLHADESDARFYIGAPGRHAMGDRYYAATDTGGVTIVDGDWSRPVLEFEGRGAARRAWPELIYRHWKHEMFGR